MAALWTILACIAPVQTPEAPAFHLEVSKLESSPYVVDLPNTWASWNEKPSSLAPPEELVDVQRNVVLDGRGRGWFGLDLIMPDQGPEVLGLWVFHLGNVEVFWDDHRVAGKVKDGIPAVDLWSPQPIMLRSSPGRHRLLIHVENPWAASLSRVAGWNGVRVRVGDPARGLDKYFHSELNHGEFHGFFTGLSLTLVLFHGLLFLFRPGRTENLVLAVAVAGAGGLMLLGYRALSAQTVAEFFAYRLGVAWLILLTSAALPLFYGAVSGLGHPRWFPFYLLLGSLATASVPWFGLGPLLVLTYLSLAMVLRALFAALRSGVKDALLLLAGAGSFSLGAALEMLCYFTHVSVAHHLTMYGLGAMLLSLSIFVARDFARTESESHRRAVALEEATRRAALVTELERVNQELQQTQAVLVQSEKMAALGQLAAGLAHEMNTPVGAIQAGRQTIEKSIEKLDGLLSDADNRVARVLRVLRDSGRAVGDGASRTAAIVKKLKNFARLDESTHQRVSIAKVIEDTLAILDAAWPQTIRRHVEVNKDLAVEGHPGELNQLLYQVLQNALQEQPGGGQVNLLAGRRDGLVEIRVEDEGPGVPQSIRQRIFDPGFTTRGVGVGLGLGLSIAYRIASGHGGTIRVADEEKPGATFIIELPEA